MFRGLSNQIGRFGVAHLDRTDPFMLEIAPLNITLDRHLDDLSVNLIAAALANEHRLKQSHRAIAESMTFSDDLHEFVFLIKRFIYHLLQTM